MKILIATCLIILPFVYGEYKIEKTKMSWTDAQKGCEKWGGNLATISSETTNAYLIGKLKASGLKEAWIGYNDQTRENNFKWMTTTLSEYTNWNAGEPNNGGNGEDCTEIVVGVRSGYQHYNGRWNDLPCTVKRPSICQKSEFKLVAKRMNWGLAKINCGSWGGHLVSILTKEQNDYLESMLKSSGLKEAWIGYNDRAEENKFKWFNGQPGNFKNWNRYEPNNLHNEDCAEIVTGIRGRTAYNGKWNDRTCLAKLPSFCQRFDVEYKVQSKKMSWADAETDCVEWGGHLTSISSKETNDYIAFMLNQSGLKGAWIGYNDIETEGSFRWKTSETGTFTNFNRGEPNNANNEDCAEIVLGKRGSTAYFGKWNDLPCTAKLPSVCQKFI